MEWMMAARWEQDLEQLRSAFPSPWRDAATDEHLVDQLAEVVREALQLKSDAPRLAGGPSGHRAVLPVATELANAGLPWAEVRQQVVECLHGLPLEVHPFHQVNVNAQPTIASLAGSLVPGLFNPNLSSDGRGAGCSEAELRMIAMTSRLIGIDPALSGGVFTFGGTGTMLYGIKLGLERACPGTMRSGIWGQPLVLASQRSHHTVLTSASWLGIGQDNVWLVPVGEDHAMDIGACRELMRQARAAGRPIAAIVATVGTTDAFGLDDAHALSQLCDEWAASDPQGRRPHLHADAVIGWAWSVFRNYDFETNPLDFDADTVAALRQATERVAGLAAVDSIGIDFHKTGFAPYVSSLLLVRERRDLERIARERATMPYLFHAGQHHPGMFTLETTRSASGVLAALASLWSLGQNGLRVLLGHAVSMSRRLRRRLATVPGAVVLNELNPGPVTLFRIYPPGIDPREAVRREKSDPAWAALRTRITAWNRGLYQQTQQAAADARGPDCGWTERYCYADDGQPIAALKSYLLSPYLDARHIDELVATLDQARRDCAWDTDC